MDTIENLQALLDTPYKVYVTVNADFHDDGTIIPRSITWEDGETYEIDKVLGQPCKAASLKAGGTGLRYSLIVEGKPTFLWLEDDCKGGGRFFVERRKIKAA